jgi:fibro-slime domain-containing protein
MEFGRPVLETSAKGSIVKSKYFFHSAFVLVLLLLGMDVSFAQTPPNTLTLTSKVRDFNEEPDGSLPVSAGRHPDFNTIGGCSGKGYVDAQILTNGLVDSAVFPLDNRNPRLISTNRGCFAGDNEFNQWFNDAATTINRPFLHDIIFTKSTTRPGMYEYENTNFYPVDDALVNAVPQTLTRNLPGSTIKNFGHNTNNNKNHNYGFTMEFHANFTFLSEIPGTRPAQKFVFRGDDDVWVFIDGKLAIDLGGVHGAQTDSITFDAATVARFGLIEGRSYVLDFFFAERHVVESNCFITTSLILETLKVGTPRATPGTSTFTSTVNVKLETEPSDAKIYYTTNGNTPDSTSTLYTGLIPITATTTIKAIAYKAGWTKSDVMTAVYTKAFVLSTLDILDANNNALVYLTEKNLTYNIKVTTTQAGLASISPVASTKVSLDREVKVLSTITNQGDNIIFTGSVPLAITTAVLASGKTEANPYDSLIVRWANPKDSTRDIAEKRILIRPAPLLATGYFSFDSTGTLPTDQYLGTETKLYLFITDQILPTGVKATVTLETQPTLGGGRVKDSEAFDMELVSPGKYRLTIPVDIDAASAVGDKKLQLSLNDGITATYKDPVDVPETIVINAGYGRAPDIEATLQFTDKLNNALPDGIHYSPDEGKLYLTYKDDWVGGTIDTVRVTLTVTNNLGKAPGDAESFTIPLILAKKSGSTGVWEGSIQLTARPEIKPGNDTADTYVLGDVLAVVMGHSKTGSPLTQAKDNLLVAYSNKVPEIIIDGKEPGVKPTREDTSIIITVIDQNLSNARDTLYTTLSCTESKDVFLNLMLIETGANTGIYKSKVISKSEGAQVSGDLTLQCLSRDNIKITYKDPVYQDTKEEQVPIDRAVDTRIYFSSNADGTGEITSVNDLTAQSFYAVVTARTPDVTKVDKLTVTFTTAQGESESFEAVETGPATGKFIVMVPFGFVSAGTFTVDNKIVEGKITAKETNNLVTATGSVTVEGNTEKKPIDLVASFAPVRKAYIKDTDGDGKGDKVYIVFEKRLGSLPATVISQWNDGAAPGKTAAGAKITFLNADSNIIVVDYKDSPFAVGATAPKAGEAPKATLPENEIFKGQKQVIEDSIGPIITSAVKKPSNLNTAIANDPNFNLDTLFITLSEPLKVADFKQMLKFSTSCDDYANAKTIQAVNVIVGEGAKSNAYTIIVDNNDESPDVGNCVFLNTDQGKYSDVPGNFPPEYGVKLEGEEGKNQIQVFRGFPPVAGLDPNNPNFQVAVQDSRDSKKQGYATPTPPGSKNPWEVAWIPPVGFVEGQTFRPYTVANINDLPSGTRETGTPIKLPANISTIQVVSTGAYIAHVSIFDIYGNFMAKSTQVFGGRGELLNQARVVPGGHLSYLYWDTRDSKGQLAGQGVYVWKVQFEFKGGKQEVQYTKTGMLRPRH